jgi:hypothetical protein
MEDKLLIRKLKKGSNEALCRIHEKYEEHLLASAISLLYDVSSAEDVVHDVFVSLAESARSFKLALRVPLKKKLDKARGFGYTKPHEYKTNNTGAIVQPRFGSHDNELATRKQAPGTQRIGTICLSAAQTV